MNFIPYEPFALRTFSFTNFSRYELYPIRTFCVTNLFRYELKSIRNLSDTNLCIRTFAYEPFSIRTFSFTNFCIRTFYIRTFSVTNILHTNPIRYEPFLLRTIAVTNLLPYELYPIRTFAYEPLLTNLFPYELCVYEPSSGYRPHSWIMYFTLKMFASPTKCASPTINPWRRHCLDLKFSGKLRNSCPNSYAKKIAAPPFLRYRRKTRGGGKKNPTPGRRLNIFPG